MEKRVIRTEAAPAPFQGAPYTQAIVVGELVFVAGQLGLAPGDTAIEGDVATQTGQALSNLGAILEAAGSSMDKLVKTSVFLLDLGDFQAMNEVYATRVGSQPPARSTFQVAALPSGARVEIEAVAHL
jgi:2-iminobutanoate/2-iminopropanoate deaminase